ncbi:hypothetical protein PTSG_07042 [Salpingoeca rosetta]|uniref:Kinetochore protein Spc24 n=1 Tax=Salpingoeca rosetta (strain ATCC 50818 / BSB-021) TaxID=946362 RepID=F2UDV9_SALR5|nr:uncharacterized protein PTSG_07042 [Salpingoeca rosetta]EGD74809.1 hypothetical protein PTSG_07042 [Salpingoeca rosetta]|eukprot:XP_004992454.1 hypothetical protein PTSG_07042 [Salpingoeca rosetta]
MASTLRKATDICQETREVLDPEEDVAKVQAIKEATHATFEGWSKEEKSLQDQIRELTREYEESKRAIPDALTEEDQERALDVLDEQLQQAATSCRTQEDALTRKRAQIKALKTEIEDLERKKVDIQRQAKENSAAAKRSTLQLYETVTGLKWEYTEQQRVSGYVSGKAGYLNTFSFNPERQTPFFIAEKLWQEIGIACQ